MMIVFEFSGPNLNVNGNSAEYNPVQPTQTKKAINAIFMLCVIINTIGKLITKR